MLRVVKFYRNYNLKYTNICTCIICQKPFCTDKVYCELFCQNRNTGKLLTSLLRHKDFCANCRENWHLPEIINLLEQFHMCIRAK